MGSTLPLLLLLSLAPAQGEKLALNNARSTYGVLGPERPDDKYLPGDILCVTFDIENLKADDTGLVSYKMGLETRNKKGEKQYSRDPQEIKVLLTLAGGRMPAFAVIEIGSDTPAGEYTMAVTVTDQNAKTTETLTRKYEILPKAFGLTRIHATYNFFNSTQGPPAPAVGVAGQNYLMNVWAANFERAKEGGDPDVTAEMTVLDEEGKATLAKPFTGGFSKDVPEKLTSMPMQFLLELNRPGKFTIKLKATDRLAKKTAEATYRLTVVESK